MKLEAYLQSAEWRRKADAALRNAQHECHFCGRPAAEVVHRTYARLGDEPIGDLAVLCSECLRNGAWKRQRRAAR